MPIKHINDIEKELDVFASNPKYSRYDWKYTINRFVNKHPQYKRVQVELYNLKTAKRGN